MKKPTSEGAQAKRLAADLRRLLDAIERGELDAGTGHGAALRRRLEGAVTGLEALELPTKRSARPRARRADNKQRRRPA